MRNRRFPFICGALSGSGGDRSYFRARLIPFRAAPDRRFCVIVITAWLPSAAKLKYRDSSEKHYALRAIRDEINGALSPQLIRETQFINFPISSSAVCESTLLHCFARILALRKIDHNCVPALAFHRPFPPSDCPAMKSSFGTYFRSTAKRALLCRGQRDNVHIRNATAFGGHCRATSVACQWLKRKVSRKCSRFLYAFVWFQRSNDIICGVNIGHSVIRINGFHLDAAGNFSTRKLCARHTRDMLGIYHFRFPSRSVSRTP